MDTSSINARREALKQKALELLAECSSTPMPISDANYYTGYATYAHEKPFRTGHTDQEAYEMGWNDAKGDFDEM